MRLLTARMALAERTLRNGRQNSGASTVEKGQEGADESLPPGESDKILAGNQGGHLQWVPTRQPPSLLAASATMASEAESPGLVDYDYHDYAFFFAGGGYGRAAEAFIREFYPQHHRFQARGFEEMFHQLGQDIRRRSQRAKRSGRQLRVSEIVFVTHANAAGGLKIPLTRGDVKRNRFYTPADLANLQEEFRRDLKNKTLQRFRRERREVVAALGEHTRIVVRGCNYGQSDEALGALRAFFGGEPMVFAPKGAQGFEILPVGNRGRRQGGARSAL